MCGREDSNLQGALAPTGPKPVASASSATPADVKDIRRLGLLGSRIAAA